MKMKSWNHASPFWCHFFVLLSKWFFSVYLFVGGAVTIALNHEALDEYIRLNPSFETVDEVLITLITSRFIPENIIRRCNASANILMTGDMQLVLKNVMNSERICHMFAAQIAEAINNPPMSDNSSDTTIAIPQVTWTALCTHL